MITTTPQDAPVADETASTHIQTPGATPRLGEFTPEVRDVILRSYQRSLQQAADLR